MQGFDVSDLIPRGFMVESATKDDGGLLVAIRAAAVFSRCPLCGTACRRVHSHYRRRLADLPAAGVKIALTLRARRFFCDDKACARRVFAERFETVEPRARRTSRLDDVVHCLAIAERNRRSSFGAITTSPFANLANRVPAAGRSATGTEPDTPSSIPTSSSARPCEGVAFDLAPLENERPEKQQPPGPRYRPHYYPG